MQVLQYLWHSGSAVVVRGLESTGSIVVRGISCFEALIRPGIRPMSAVLAGGFLLCPREVCGLFDDSHSDWCEVIPHCSFNLHLCNN